MVLSCLSVTTSSLQIFKVEPDSLSNPLRDWRSDCISQRMVSGRIEGISI